MIIIKNLKMKFTLAIAALLGYTQAITMYNLKGDPIYVQLNGDGDDEVDHSNEYFLPNWDGALGLNGEGYSRVIPSRFSGDSDDIFMRSMIKTYALEQKTKEGAPSGKFWMNEASTRAAAAEVLANNVHMKSSDVQAYLKTYFAKAWGHFDVNRTGMIEVIKMPQFMRFLASDQYLSLQHY